MNEIDFHPLLNSFERFAALKTGKCIGVAVSGGGDSMALLSLLSTWCRNRPDSLFVVSVDHGLRAGSAGECQLVADFTRRIGHRFQLLHWQPTHRGNLQNQARDARYRLISDWAISMEIGTVALAHTMDDQSETLILNLARGSGIDGLSAMPSEVGRNGIEWIRPLLGVRRAALRSYLEEQNIPWVDDPSNDDPRFDRVKARRLIMELAPLGISVERLAATAHRVQDARLVIESETDKAADFVAELTDWGEILFDANFWELEDEIRTRLAADALRTVSGNLYRPRYKSLIAALGKGRSGTTLSGCVLRVVEDNKLLIAREPAACGAAVRYDRIWDGRWRLDSANCPDSAVIAALGESGLAQIGVKIHQGRSRTRCLSLPGLWLGDQLLAAPIGSFGSVHRFRLADRLIFGSRFRKRY